MDHKGLKGLGLGEELSNQDLTSHAGAKIKKRKERMNLLKGCKFALRDSRNFDNLTSRLIEYIESLQKMCSPHDCDVSIITERYHGMVALT